MAIGTLACFYINAKGDNKGFIERYVCISVPVENKLILVSIVVLILLFIVVTMSNTHFYHPWSDILAQVCGCLFAVAFYVSMYKSMKEISHRSQNV
jgi:hypothetical protein